MKTFSIVALLGVLVAADQDCPERYTSSDRADFTEYLTLHPELNVSTTESYEKRLCAWWNTKQRRNQTQNMRSGGARSGKRRPLGKFAAWTEDEKSQLKGLLGGDVAQVDSDQDQDQEGQSGQNRDGRRGRKLATTEPVYSLMWDEDITGSVEDQGRCGSCWAFAGLHTMESAVAIKTGSRPNPRYSKQEFMDCSDMDSQNFTRKHFFSDIESKYFTNDGCYGAYSHHTFEFLTQAGAMPEVGTRDYKGTDASRCTANTAKANCACKWTDSGNTPTKLASYKEGYKADPYDIANELRNGPMAIAIAAGDGLSDYDKGDGIGYGNAMCSNQLNHLVVLVGFHPGNHATKPGARRMLDSESETEDLDAQMSDSESESDTDELDERMLKVLQGAALTDGGRQLHEDDALIFFDTEDPADAEFQYYCHPATRVRRRRRTRWQCPSEPAGVDWIITRLYGQRTKYCCFEEVYTPEDTTDDTTEDTTDDTTEDTTQDTTGPTGDASDPTTWVPYTKDNVEASEAYWIIKNSWGDDWGEDGYVYVYFAEKGQGKFGQGWCGMYAFPTHVRYEGLDD